MYCDIPDIGRCCFCMPLRRGVLIFGYLNLIFSAFMVFMYSYHSQYDESVLIYKGVSSHSMAPAVCIAIYCLEIIVNSLLVYGAHRKNIMYLNVFYYYTMLSMLAALVLQFVEIFSDKHQIEMIILAFAGLMMQTYLLLLVRSLLRKLEQGSEHSIENQLHTIVLGEPTVDNRIYNNTTTLSDPIKDDF